MLLLNWPLYSNFCMSLQFQYDLGELIQEFFKTNSICEHKMCALLKYSIKLKEAIWKVVQNYLRRGIVGILKLAIFPANWEWLQFKCPPPLNYLHAYTMCIVRYLPSSPVLKCTGRLELLLPRELWALGKSSIFLQKLRGFESGQTFNFKWWKLRRNVQTVYCSFLFTL